MCGRVAGKLIICLYRKSFFVCFFLERGSNSSGCVALNSVAAVANRANKQENKSAMTSVRGGAGEKCTCERVCKL